MPELTSTRAVDRFLATRRQLIVHLMKLSKALDDNHHDIAQVLLLRFCENLVDYLGDGYFRIYGDLLSSHTWATPREYAIFESTTSTAMTFNDRFADKNPTDMPATRRALANVALALETRFELEDQLFDRTQESIPALASAS